LEVIAPVSASLWLRFIFFAFIVVVQVISVYARLAFSTPKRIAVWRIRHTFIVISGVSIFTSVAFTAVLSLAVRDGFFLGACGVVIIQNVS